MDTRDTGRMTPAPESPDAARDILNIPIAMASSLPSIVQANWNGYIYGHRDARHAAVEIVNKHITRLTAERDAALRDAGRYRWLRDKGSATWVPFTGQWKMDAEHCDAAIDNEMARAALSAQERGNV